MAFVTGWGQNIDDLAGAVADLLIGPAVPASPLSNVAATLACRDAVVVQLRQLVGSVADVAPLAKSRPLQVFDVTDRPAQALHLALTGLPRATPFGAADISTYFEKGLPAYEQRWRDAARASCGLEIFVEDLVHVPDRHSWLLLRDLADLAAAIPTLDQDLSEVLLPGLQGRVDLAAPYAALTHRAHDAVRVCATEIRSRVAAAPPSNASAPPTPAVLGAGELGKAMDRCVRTVLVHGSMLSLGDVRGVARLLQLGATSAAVALERAQQAVPGADAAAAALRQLAALAVQLRDSPIKTLGPGRLDVLRASNEVLARMAALTVQERAVPGGASDTALRRLAVPALEFAQHVPNLAQALGIGVREALAAGGMLVPSVAERRNTSTLLWVRTGPPSRGSRRGGPEHPPAVLQQVKAISEAAEGVSSGVKTARAALDRQQGHAAEPARQPAAAARSYLGGARAQLREVLGQQAGTVPPPLSAPLPGHPRWTPDGPVPGRGR